MRPFEELLKESTSTHGHHCAGQVLGVRMAMAGCREINIDEPRGCKKLIVYVEMDRCATDAVQAVTGCSLGKRTLKFLDYGKMATTFVNTETGKAVRVLARDDARLLAPRYSQNATNPREAQKQAYAVMPEDELFSIRPATIDIPEENMPGFRGTRVYCDSCGEGINLRREVRQGGRTLCIPCSNRSFAYDPEPRAIALGRPKVLLIVGYKKVGKTTLIEKLIGELSSRGYRVATVKHHHSDLPALVDTVGTDTWRHRSAGAKSVAFVSPTNVALFRDTDGFMPLDHLVSAFGNSDIVLVEGFHLEPRAKIEVLETSANPLRLCGDDKNLLAVVGETPGEKSVPCFAPADLKALADFIEQRLLRPFSHRHPLRQAS
jgi:formylmethanofuran dehydrogenase subunit E